MNWEPLLILLAVGSAAVGGVFLAFSTLVMPALAQLPATEAVKAMQHINVTVLRSVFLWLLLGTALGALLSTGVLAQGCSGTVPSCWEAPSCTCWALFWSPCC